KYSRALTRTLLVRAQALSNTGREAGVFTSLGPTPLRGYDGTGSPLSLYDTQVDAAQGQAELEWDISPGSDLIGGVSVDTRRARGSDRSYGYRVSADAGPPFLLEAPLSAPSDRYTIYSA